MLRTIDNNGNNAMSSKELELSFKLFNWLKIIQIVQLKAVSKTKIFLEEVHFFLKKV